MRVLFATLPAHGHAAPLSAVAEEVARRGHEVAWVAHGDLRERLFAGARWFDTGGPGAAHAEPRDHRPLSSTKAYFGQMLPAVTKAAMPVLDEAIAAFAPQVVVVEQNCLAGSIAARRAGVPWVVVHVTPVLLLSPFRVLPGLEAWIDREVGQLQRAYGVEPLPWPIRSPFGTLVASSLAFLGPEVELCPGDEMVGALVGSPREVPLEGLGEAPRILVTLGTLATRTARGFLECAVEGLAGLGTVLVASRESLTGQPGVVVRPWWPLPDLFRHVKLVVSHGGQGTVHEALLNGVPMVLAPIQFDQPLVAARVEALGAGRVVAYSSPDSTMIREAAASVLGDPAYAAAARAVGASLGPGTMAAADRILAVGA